MMREEWKKRRRNGACIGVVNLMPNAKHIKERKEEKKKPEIPTQQSQTKVTKKQKRISRSDRALNQNHVVMYVPNLNRREERGHGWRACREWYQIRTTEKKKDSGDFSL